MGGAEKGCGVGVGETVPGVNGRAPVPSLRGNLQAFGRNDTWVGLRREASSQAFWVEDHPCPLWSFPADASHERPPGCLSLGCEAGWFTSRKWLDL